MNQKLETNSKVKPFVNNCLQLVSESDVKPKNFKKKGKHNDNDRRHRRPDMKLYVPPKAKNNNCPENDGICSEDNNYEDMSQKLGQTLESLSELEITTDSSLERHEIELSKTLSEDCIHRTSTKCKDISASGEEQNEISWDSMFDENGESIRCEFNELIDCKNSELKLEKSRIDYHSFQYNEPDIDGSEFGHILEVYDFDMELKTQDIITYISVFNCRDFDVKWVDDSHALVVFCNTNVANEALKHIYPNIKLRPLSQGIRESKLKARNCSEFLQPYKQRPQTSATLARRLVTQSLGLRDRITPEERAAERKKLAEAKERKRLATKQVLDVWEGNV